MARVGSAVMALILFAACAPARRGGESHPAPLATAAPSASVAVTAPAPDTTHWMTGSSSPATEHGYPEAPVCLVDEGCPFAPAPLPKCPPGLDAIEVDATRLDGLVGRTVVVRGELSARTGLVLLGVRCMNGFPTRRPGEAAQPPVAKCCEQAAPLLVVSDALELLSEENPHAFSCRGDESWLCCPLVPGSNVAAVGRIERAGRATGYALVSPRICTLDPPVPVPAGLTVTATGCRFRDGDHPGDEVVVTEGVACGCDRGRAVCRNADSPACFHRGRWFADGESFWRHRPCERWTCRGTRWERAADRCEGEWRLGAVEFVWGDASFDGRERQQVPGLDRLLGATEFSLVVTSLIAPDEGAKAKRLAELRAKVLRDHLVGLGYDRKRIRVEVTKTTPDGYAARHAIVTAVLGATNRGHGFWSLP